MGNVVNINLNRKRSNAMAGQTIKIKLSDLFEYLSGLDRAGNLKSVKLGYAVAKNRSEIMKEVKIVQSRMESSKEFSEYSQKVADLGKKYANKDDKGRPVQFQGQFQGCEGNPEYDKPMEELKEKYKEVIEEREKQMEEYKELMKMEIDFDVYQIDFSEVEKVEGITVDQINGIFFMIKE